jgi:PPOX class probable F420-dependent enzyme
MAGAAARATTSEAPGRESEEGDRTYARCWRHDNQGTGLLEPDPVSRRDQIRMTDSEVRAFLDQQRTLQVASINPDGTPHLVAMWYGIGPDGDLIFWTYRKSQKVVNLRRDPRLTCMVEDGDKYEDLRGVSITGTAELSDDPERIERAGETILARYHDGPIDESAREGLRYAGAKRVVITVRPVRLVSWDHRKLGGVY